jgi:hypothetical protein
MKTDAPHAPHELYENATCFLNTHRGNYIVGQALAVAIIQLSAAPEHRKEKSNIRDMIFLLDNLFPLGKIFFADREETTQIKRQE